MSFDFSVYDYEPDSQYDSIPSTNKIKPALQMKLPESKGDFDFGAYDYEEKPTQSSTYKNPFKVEPVSNEDYEKMSISEKIRYADALEKEGRYESSKALTKNAASSATLGFSEDIPGLKPEEGEDPIAAAYGHAIGQLPYIWGASKLVGVGLGASFGTLKNAPQYVKTLYNFLHTFGTGATIETGKQTANALRGEEVNLTQIPYRGAEFVLLDKIFKTLGAAGKSISKRFGQISSANQAKILEDGLIPKDLPKSQYETAEEVLDLLRKNNKAPDNFPRPGGPPPPGGEPSSGSGFYNSNRIDPNRVKANGEDLGLRPTSRPHKLDLQDSVGDIFSKEKFYNSTQGGQALKNEITEIDNDVYKGVNDLYKNSRELNSEINNIQPELVDQLEAHIAKLSDIPEPSDVQKRVLKTAKKVLNRLASYENIKDEAGNIIGREINGYLPINNQTLIDQVQSLRQIIDYDFAHGNTKNIFRPLINDLQDAAIQSATQVGRPEAAEALNNSKYGYRTWVEAFDNDYIRPFRDTSNKDYSKLFKSSLDLDESNMVRQILNLSEKGQRLSSASTREIVEKHLSKYFDNPKATSPKEFDKVIRELEAVITPEQAQQIRDQFRESQKGTSFNAKKTPKRTLTNDERIAAKYEGLEPEDIQRMMNKRSGIKHLREDLNSPEKKVVFERLKQQKIRSILREGNIEKEFTGDELYQFLNKEKNYELLSEMLGETETEALRQSSKEIGKRQVKSEVRNKSIGKAAKKIAAYKTFEIILGLL